MQSDELTLKEEKVQVSVYWGKIDKSRKGYWGLIDEIEKRKGEGKKMMSLNLRNYET